MFQSFAISVAMVSLIKKKELHEMQPTDYFINGDEKIFLEEQLKYYFEFSDNRWNLNVVESQLDVSIEVYLLAPIYKKAIIEAVGSGLEKFSAASPCNSFDIL